MTEDTGGEDHRCLCAEPKFRVGQEKDPVGSEQKTEKRLLVHPIGCWLEPVDDLLVVYGKESDADEGYNERDVVP